MITRDPERDVLNEKENERDSMRERKGNEIYRNEINELPEESCKRFQKERKKRE